MDEIKDRNIIFDVKKFEKFGLNKREAQIENYLRINMILSNKDQTFDLMHFSNWDSCNTHSSQIEKTIQKKVYYKLTKQSKNEMYSKI